MEIRVGVLQRKNLNHYTIRELIPNYYTLCYFVVSIHNVSLTSPIFKPPLNELLKEFAQKQKIHANQSLTTVTGGKLKFLRENCTVVCHVWYESVARLLCRLSLVLLTAFSREMPCFKRHESSVTCLTSLFITRRLNYLLFCTCLFFKSLSSVDTILIRI